MSDDLTSKIAGILADFGGEPEFTAIGPVDWAKVDAILGEFAILRDQPVPYPYIADWSSAARSALRDKLETPKGSSLPRQKRFAREDDDFMFAVDEPIPEGERIVDPQEPALPDDATVLGWITDNGVTRSKSPVDRLARVVANKLGLDYDEMTEWQRATLRRRIKRLS